MAKQLFTNNAATELLSAITDVATSIQVNTGKGGLFATPSGGDYQLATISNSTDKEIVKITGRSGDVLTVVRGQEGTTAQAWPSLTSIEGRITKETLEGFFQTPNTNTASGTNGIAIGANSNVQGTGSIGIGDTAKTFANQEIAIGSTSQAQGASSIAIGYLSDTYSDYEVAVGHNTQVQGDGSVGIGKNAATFAAGEIAIGKDAQAQGTSAIAIGELSDTYNNYDIAIGYNAQVSQVGATGIGNGVVASGQDAIGIGTSANAAGTGSIGIGKGATTRNSTEIAIGNNAQNPDAGATPANWASATTYANDDVRLISGRRCRAVLGGTSGGTIPTVPAGNGNYFLDGTSSTGVVWVTDELINSNTITIGNGAYGYISIGGSSKSIGGMAIGYGSFANTDSFSIGSYGLLTLMLITH